MTDVLLAIDRSEARAEAQAKTVRDLFDAAEITAHLFHDFTDNPEGASITQVGAVRHAADILEAAGFAIEYHEGSGEPADEIIDLADDLDVDAICIAGRKRSPAGKLLFGSVSQDVILGTTRPVLVCNPTQDEY